MAWTLKTLTPRPSSSCMVVSCKLSALIRKKQSKTEIGAFINQILVFASLLHNADTNGDGFFDEQELEALFTKEVKP